MKRERKPASEAELIKLLKRAAAPPRKSTDRRRLIAAMGSVDWGPYRWFRSMIAKFIEERSSNL